MKRRQRNGMIAAAAAGLWLAVGLVVVPELLESIYRSGAVPVLSEKPLEFFLEQWRGIVWYGAAAGTAVGLFVWGLHDRAISTRLVPDARPSDLGAIRILVAGVLLISTLWEDLASTAALPGAMRNPPGVMQLLAAIPGYESFAASAFALELFKWLTALALFCAMVGLKTRIAVPAGVVLYLVLGGWLRQYAWFYHTGLIPLYLLAVLSFLPSGQGLSLDRRLQRSGDRTPDVPSRRFGWARYAVWTALALPYVAAGLSKVRNGGLYWWEASNFKHILFQSSLRPMEFDFELSLALASAPDRLFEAMAITAVLGELLYGLVLVSPRARQVIPVVMLLMHVGILFLQNILFFDLILLQLVYLNFRPLLHRLARNGAVVDRAQAVGGFGTGPVPTPEFTPAPSMRTGPTVTVAVTVVLALCWVFRVEFYPFTGMQMFSTKQSEPLTYEIALAHTGSGEVIRAPIEKSIGAMADSRYRRILQMAFDEEREELSHAFMDAVVGRWNRTANADRQIRRIEIQRWEWLYLTEPEDPEHGRLADRVVYSFDGEMPGR